MFNDENDIKAISELMFLHDAANPFDKLEALQGFAENLERTLGYEEAEINKLNTRIKSCIPPRL